MKWYEYRGCQRRAPPFHTADLHLGSLVTFSLSIRIVRGQRNLAGARNCSAACPTQQNVMRAGTGALENNPLEVTQRHEIVRFYSSR